MEKRVLIVIVVAIAAIAGAGTFLALQHFKTPVVQTKEFEGNLQSIKGSSIFVKGEPFLVDAKVGRNVGSPSDMPTVEIIVTTGTKITRTTFRIPTTDALKKTNGMFEPEKLPREQSAVSLDMLEKDFKTTQYPIGVRAVSAANVNGRQKFAAKQLEYIFPVQ